MTSYVQTHADLARSVFAQLESGSKHRTASLTFGETNAQILWVSDLLGVPKMRIDITKISSRYFRVSYVFPPSDDNYIEPQTYAGPIIRADADKIVATARELDASVLEGEATTESLIEVMHNILSERPPMIAARTCRRENKDPCETLILWTSEKPGVDVHIKVSTRHSPPGKCCVTVKLEGKRAMQRTELPACHLPLPVPKAKVTELMDNIINFTSDAEKSLAAFLNPDPIDTQEGFAQALFAKLSQSGLTCIPDEKDPCKAKATYGSKYAVSIKPVGSWPGYWVNLHRSGDPSGTIFSICTDLPVGPTFDSVCEGVVARIKK